MPLTEQEKQKLQDYLVPEERQETYPWESEYQRQVLSMLLHDRTFLIQSIQLVKPKYFKNTAHELICEILFNHFNKYKQLPPKSVIVTEINEQKKNDQKLFWYKAELEACLMGYIPGLNSREHCLDWITEFAKEQALRSALSISLDVLKTNPENKWVKIRELFRDALLVDRNFDTGLDYFTSLEDRYTRMAQADKEKEIFCTGFSDLDNRIACGGLMRGEIGAFMALPGVGKSNLLIKAAVVNFIRKKKILHISLEMDQDKIAKRFDAQLAGISIGKLLENKNAVLHSVKSLIDDYDDKTRLIIKQFPGGTADVDTIRAYMAQLNLHGFKPDLLLLDYVGEMKDIEGIKIHESRQRLVRDLRGFGVEEGHCTLTAMQPNRQGREQQEENVIDDSTLGDSFGQARPLDALWSINQTQIEKKMNVGRIFVVKHRDGQSRYTLHFKQNVETLDFEQISSAAYYDIMSQYKEKKGEEVIGKFKPNKGKYES